MEPRSCRERSVTTQQPVGWWAVYLHRDAAGSVIYVGCSSNVRRRTYVHRCRSAWWADVTDVLIESLWPDKAAALTRESELIARYRPSANNHHNPVTGNGLAPQDDGHELLTTAEIARITGRPVGTVNRWASQGKLVAQKLPGRTGSRLYRRSDLAHILESA